jgi:DHA2 family multidrug resistance protein-like MFS transporter
MSTRLDAVTNPSNSRATPRSAWLALAVLMLPVLLIAIDNTVLAFALPAISEDLRPAASTQLWIIDVYSLVLAGLLVAMGSFGDRVGRRKLLMIGSTGFAVVSVVAAFAPSAAFLVGARAALGVFGAMLMPSTMSLIRNIFVEASARRLAIAIWASCFTAGAALGPIVGGALLQHFHWGAVFLVAVPILLPLLILAPRLVPESRDPNPGPLDLTSVALSFVALLPFVWAIKTAAHDGLSVAVGSALVISLAAGTVFVRRQNRSATPMLDISLFSNPPLRSSVLANFLSIVGLIGFLFFTSQHLQLVLGLSPLAAGLVTLPGALVSMVAGIGVVRVTKYIRPQLLMVAGLVAVALGYALILLFRHDLSILAVLVSFVVLEVGVGVSQTISNDTIVASVPAAKSGAASAVSETAYELGAVVGMATLGTIFTAFYRANVTVPAGLTATQAADAGESIAGATAVAGELPASTADALLDSARTAFDSGIAPTAIIAGLLTLAAAVIVAVSFRDRTLPVSGSADRSVAAPIRPAARRSGRGSTRSTAPDRPATARQPRRATGRRDPARRADCSAER